MENKMDQTESIKKLKAALGLSKEVIGVKLLRTAEEYELFPASAPKHRLSYCLMVRMAAYGRSLKAEDRHFKCNGARRALGLMPLDHRFISGQHYEDMGLYQNRNTAKDVANDMAFLKGPMHGVAVYPLESRPEDADGILVICPPYQAMRIIQGYAYGSGIPPQIRLVGNQGVCSELTAFPLLSGKINISLLCSGTRFACKWKDSEMGVGLPFHLFSQMIEGVMATLNPTEPDARKHRIQRRMASGKIDAPIVVGENYYKSEPGSEKLKD